MVGWWLRSWLDEGVVREATSVMNKRQDKLHKAHNAYE